ELDADPNSRRLENSRSRTANPSGRRFGHDACARRMLVAEHGGGTRKSRPGKFRARQMPAARGESLQMPGHRPADLHARVHSLRRELCAHRPQGQRLRPAPGRDVTLSVPSPRWGEDEGEGPNTARILSRAIWILRFSLRRRGEVLRPIALNIAQRALI